MTNNNLIMSWKIIWKVWKQSNPEAKMSIMSISYPLFTSKHKKKDPFLLNLINNSIEKELALSKSILDSELHSLNLTVFNSKQKPLSLISEENTSVLILNGKMFINNMEITSQDCPIQTLHFSKTLMKRVIQSILVWEELRITLILNGKTN